MVFGKRVEISFGAWIEQRFEMGRSKRHLAVVSVNFWLKTMEKRNQANIIGNFISHQSSFQIKKLPKQPFLQP